MSPGTVVDLKYRMIDFFVLYFISLYFLVDISYFDAILYLFGIILLLSSNTVCSHFRIAATSLSVWSQCCPFSTKFSRQLFFPKISLQSYTGSFHPEFHIKYLFLYRSTLLDVPAPNTNNCWNSWFPWVASPNATIFACSGIEISSTVTAYFSNSFISAHYPVPSPPK